MLLTRVKTIEAVLTLIAPRDIVTADKINIWGLQAICDTGRAFDINQRQSNSFVRDENTFSNHTASAATT